MLDPLRDLHPVLLALLATAKYWELSTNALRVPR